MRLLIDTLNFSWHCAAMCKDPSNFREFTSAFFMFSLKQWKQNKYSDIVYAMDKGSFRYSSYEGYKQNRYDKIQKDEASEKEIKPTFKKEDVMKVGELLTSIGIPFIYQQNYEADDIIGSLIQQNLHSNEVEIILSTDQDYEQLIVNDNIHLYKYKRGFFSLKDVQEKYNGRFGKDMLPIKAVTGDKGDNVIGIKGIGLKTALKLFDEYKDLEKITKAIDSKEDKKLLKYSDSWSLSNIQKNIQCVEIYKDLEIDYNPFSIKITKEAEEKFEEYEVSHLLKHIQDYKNYYSNNSFAELFEGI